MNRYYYDTYRPSVIPQPYSLYLTLDGILFTIEAALFFVMSRALPLSKWRLFYLCVLSLLLVDSIWAAVARTHSPDITPWLILNVVSVPVLVVILLFLSYSGQTIIRSTWRYYAVVYILPLLATVRTIIDYWLMWPFYFPTS